jgi:diacylglycerol O-acyltransferase
VLGWLTSLLGSGAERLAPLDASFLYLERESEPLHVGSVTLLDGRVDFDELVAVLGERLGALPRYRCRPIRPLLDLGAPTWEPDQSFDPRNHVRRVTIPPPGDDAALHMVVDSLFATPCNSGRPLWETYLLDGLSGGRSAVLSKVHHCMIDGVSGSQILELMTDPASPDAAGPPAPSLASGPRPGLRPPPRLRPIQHATAVAQTFATLAATVPPPLPFNGRLSPRRRIVWATFTLDSILALRGAAGCKVNDVVLAIIAGALARHLEARGVAPAARRVRALVPVSVRGGDERLALGNRVSAMFADLPLDVVDPVARLALIARQMREAKERGEPQAVGTVLALAGAMPSAAAPRLLDLSTRWPMVNTVCTNVPGPPEPRTLCGRRVTAIHPIVPLGLNMGLGFAILSYAGTVSISATADPTLVPTANDLAGALYESAAELEDRLGVGASPIVSYRAAGTRVRDLMSRQVVTIDPSDSLASAWEAMRRHGIRHLPVVDRRGTLVGILSHRDLLAASHSTLAFGAVPDRVRLLAWAHASDVMETHVSTARPDDPAAAAGRRMRRHRIGCLPVIDERGRLAGIVTEDDFLAWATTQMEETAA